MHEMRAGFILIDIILALSLGMIFVAIIAEMSLSASSTFHRAQSRAAMLDAYVAGKALVGQTGSYGNDMTERDDTVSTMVFPTIAMRPLASLSDAAGAPFCSVDMSGQRRFGAGKSGKFVMSPISLPVSASVGSALTDIQVRNGIAYISADSALASDPDLFIVDISSTTAPRVRSTIDTGPGIAAIVLAGRRIYAAAASAAAELHVIRLDSLDSPVIEGKFKVPLPYATATPPVGSAISYDQKHIYLGTEKWDGQELSVIDVSHPAQPVFDGGAEIGGKVASISMRDSIGYVGAAGVHQLSTIDARDPFHPISSDVFQPSGWARQEGEALSVFEGSLTLGRTSGGFDMPADHELFAWPNPVPNWLGPASLNIPGGVYGIVMDRYHIYVATRQAGKELVIFDQLASTSASTTQLSTSTMVAYHMPNVPKTLTCDGTHLYMLAHGAPFIYDISFIPN